MNKGILTTVCAITIAFLFSGCAAFHSGNLSNSAALSNANFSYVKQNVQGEAKARYILGIGGFAKQSLVDQAKQKMVVNTPLQSNQALVNQTVNFKSSFYFGLIYRTVKCTVTSDIVEFK